jgi:quinol monooxygenase YgiN
MAQVLRVVRWHSRPDTAQQLAQSVTDLLGSEPPRGLVRAYVVRDLGDLSVVLLMSVFDSLEDMAANTPSLEASLALLRSMLVEEPEISSYELLAS